MEFSLRTCWARPEGGSAGGTATSAKLLFAYCLLYHFSQMLCEWGGGSAPGICGGSSLKWGLLSLQELVLTTVDNEIHSLTSFSEALGGHGLLPRLQNTCQSLLHKTRKCMLKGSDRHSGSQPPHVSEDLTDATSSHIQKLLCGSSCCGFTTCRESNPWVPNPQIKRTHCSCTYA